MNRDTRDKFASGTQKDITSGNAVWETAPFVWAGLLQDFGPFDIDLTADAQRALRPLWFGPGSPVGEYDSLTAAWSSFGTSGYSNPPYGPFVPHILKKAKHEAASGFRSLFLLPLRITRAFRKHVLDGASDIILPSTRLVFFENGLPRCGYDEKGKVHLDSAMFDSMLVQYSPAHVGGPRMGEWQVPKLSKEARKNYLAQWVAIHPYDQWKAEQAGKKRAA